MYTQDELVKLEKMMFDVTQYVFDNEKDFLCHFNKMKPTEDMYDNGLGQFFMSGSTCFVRNYEYNFYLKTSKVLEWYYKHNNGVSVR